MIGRALRAIGRAARAAVRHVRASLHPPLPEDDIPISWRDGDSSRPPSGPTIPAVPARMPGRSDPSAKE